MSLFWRIFTALAAVLTLATAALIAAPTTLTLPLSRTEVVEIALGFTALLAGMAVVVHRALRPLEELRAAIEQRQAVLEPGRAEPARVPVRRDDEVGRVAAAYNALLDRLAGERARAVRLVVDAQEAERRRVGRELHDEVGQSLTVVLLRLKRLADQAPAALADDVAATQDVTRSALGEVRALAARLRPGALEDLGLTAALTTLASDAADTGGLLLRRDIASSGDLSPEQELTIYRVAQEALTNVLRHACAESVSVVLRGDAAAITLTVTDDGVGLQGRAGSGVNGMRERALLVGGDLALGATPGGGTTVTLTMPRHTSLLYPEENP
ncbi:MAG: histidine kinase [Tetrasphaera sp.]